MSYTIDLYRNKTEPTRNFSQFAAFVSFFPQLVAGPIERASNLLPQFAQKRVFDKNQAVDGLRQILWGLTKKIIIADGCATFVQVIFENSSDASGSTLLFGAILFAFQIYGDFSGYSDIAIGTARLFGFNLKQNFAFPYFSRDISEFWRRWHISLSSWFKDYVYIPLGGSRGSQYNKIRNTFIIFLVSGFWHGANWTFVAWGAINALYFIPLILMAKNRSHLDVVASTRSLPSIKEFFQISLTFFLVVIAWVLFRADSISHAGEIYGKIFSSSLLSMPDPQYGIAGNPFRLILLIFGFILIEWKGRKALYGIEKFGLTWPRYLRWTFYYILFFSLFFYGGRSQDFIYFQF